MYESPKFCPDAGNFIDPVITITKTRREFWELTSMKTLLVHSLDQILFRIEVEFWIMVNLRICNFIAAH